MKFKNNCNCHHSLSNLVINSFLVFVIVLFVLISFIYVGLTAYVDHSFPLTRIQKLIDKVPTMNDIDYTRFDSEHYVGENGDLFLLNENGSLLYTSDNTSYSDFLTNELTCIPDYNSNTRNSISEYKTPEGEKRYLLTNELWSDNDIREVQGYILLDENLNILTSTYLENRTSLSMKEISYLTGENSKGNLIRKFTFKNPSNQTRILIFTIETGSQETYSRALNALNNVWWYFIPTYVLLVICFVCYIFKKINLLLKPLDKIIDTPNKSKFNIAKKSPQLNMFLDIADKYEQLSEELAQSEWERIYLDNSKNQLLADISHDLRTPITVIQGYSRALKDGIVPEKEKKKYLDTIYKKSERIAELVSTFHEYSLLDHPDMPVNLSNQDICSVIQVYFANKYEELELAGFELVADIPEYSIECKIDVKLFCRAIENLVNNSFKYNKPDTTIYIGVQKHNNTVKIYIGDTGSGISDAIADKLFEPFVTGECSRGANHGSGLGLAITKKIIVSHHGTIDYIKVSKHNCNTEYVITLPLAK